MLIRNSASLKSQHKQWVENWDRKWTARVHCLLNVGQWWVGVLLDLASTFRVVNHFHVKLLLVDGGLRVDVASVSRKYLKKLAIRWLYRLSSFQLVVKVRTMTFLAIIVLVATLRGFVVIWMILHFFPPVAKATTIFIFTTVLVGLCIFFSLPARTLGSFIFVEVRRPSVILPIVGIDTGVTLVLFVRLGAPHSLEVKQVEVGVTLILIQLCYRQLGAWMSKGTMLPVFTLSNFVREMLTVLWFVLFWVVKVFDSIVSHVTWVAVGTRGSVCIRDWAHIRAVRGGHSPAVF